MQRDKDFLKEYLNRHKPKKKKRFRFPEHYLSGNVNALKDYFKE